MVQDETAPGVAILTGTPQHFLGPAGRARPALWLLVLACLAAGGGCGSRSVGGNPSDSDGAPDDSGSLLTCGNGHVEPSEACDYAITGGTSCAALGFVDGILWCDDTCQWDTSDCRGGPWLDLSVGSHSCARDGEGRWWCWGSNDMGRLGDGSLEHQPCGDYDCSPVPVLADPLTPMDTLTLAASSCGVAEGGLWCWGSAHHGVLGEDAETIQCSDWPDFCSPVPQPVAVDGPVSSVALGEEHVCVVQTSGRAWCWGNNDYGQLGDSTLTSRTRPERVVVVTDFVSVVAGVHFTCGLRADATVQCWGDNRYGQVGDELEEHLVCNGETDCIDVPCAVSGLADVVQVSAYFHHACVVTGDGGVSCWGYNHRGQVGDGTYENRNAPTAVLGIEDVIQVAAGDRFTCALRADGTVWCWGANWSGSLGDGSTQHEACDEYDCSTTPVQVVGIADGVDLAAGNHGCALRADGTVWCWGSNQFGGLGDGQTHQECTIGSLYPWDCSPIPVRVDHSMVR